MITKIILAAFLMIALASVNSYARGGGESSAGTRGGGDMQALEFTNYGRALIQDFSKFGSKTLADPETPKKLVQALNQFRVSSVAALPLDSNHVAKEAVTDLKQKTVEINRKAWNDHAKTLISKLAIVFHEYLRAAGFGALDESYEVSNAFLKILSSKWDYSMTSLVERQYNAASRLRAIIKDKRLSCLTLGRNRNEISIIVNRDEGGLNHLMISDAGNTYAEDLVGQFSMGENIFVAYGDDGRYYLQVPMPNHDEACQLGISTAQPTSSDVPTTDVVRCCISK